MFGIKETLYIIYRPKKLSDFFSLFLIPNLAFEIPVGKVQLDFCTYWLFPWSFLNSRYCMLSDGVNAVIQLCKA